ncbi:MAG: O-antigen ligase family protein [bacterium]|nr:O-antigen ligase family protein [bacterium]
MEQNTPHPNLLLIKEKVWNVPRGTIFKTPFSFMRRRAGDEVAGSKTAWLFWIIMLSGLFQGIIGIVQFFLQKSIGLFWLRESLISPNILGVAKVILHEETYVRAYGLMPHPNVLGGFLVFSIIITLLYKQLFHACPQQECSTPARDKNVPRGTFLGGWNIFGRVEQLWFFNLILAIQILALILTFSKSAIIGLLIALVYINVPRGTLSSENQGSSIDCSTWNIFGRVEHLKLIILSTLILLASTFFILKPNLDSLLFNSFSERLFYLNVPRGTFESDPIFGIGAGQSVLFMQKYFPQKLEFWQYQPVHNVFLLIFSELGLVGLGLFIWWLWKLFHPVNSDNVPRGTLSEHGAGAEQKKKDLTPLSFIRRGAGGEVDMEQEYNGYILHNDNTYLSSTIFSRYFQGILLGLIFIMLFDHYIWDIQQGSLLFWLTAGFVAGINRK